MRNVRQSAPLTWVRYCRCSGVSGHNSLEAAAEQAGRVGADSVPLLPQLGDLHLVDVDAHILQSGTL